MFHRLGCIRLALMMFMTVIVSGSPDSRSSATDVTIQLPSDTRMISYIESVASKNRVETYRNKVFLAEDGRKRVEHLTAKHGLISILDDWGIQRLIMRSELKTASVWDEIEPFGQGPEKLHSWIDGYKRLCNRAERDLRSRRLDDRLAVGFQASEYGRTITIWIDEKNSVPVRIGIDDPEYYTTLTDFRFETELNETKFSFDVPEDYNVLERHTKAEYEKQ